MRTKDMRADQIRQAVTKTARMLAKEAITITQIGAGAYCKFNPRTGKVERINLPVIPDKPTDEFLEALQGYLDHEVGHALHTNPKDYANTINAKALGLPKAVVHNIINIVEDVRMEAAMAKQFAGSETNLEATRSFVIKTVWAPKIDGLGDPLDPANVNAAASTAFVPYLRARGGQRSCQKFMEERGLYPLFAKVDAAIPDLADRIANLKDTRDAALLAAELLKHLAQPPQSSSESMMGDESEESEKGQEGQEGKDQKPKKGKGSKPKKDDEKAEETDESKGNADNESDDGEADEAEDEGSGSAAGEDDEAEADEQEGDGEGDGEGGSGDDAQDGEQEGSGSSDEADGDAKDKGEVGSDGKGKSDATEEDSDGDGDGDEVGDGKSTGKSNGGQMDAEYDNPEDTLETEDSNGDMEDFMPGVGPGSLCPDIDWDEVRDLDSILEGVIQEQLHGAFDGTTQVDLTRDYDRVVPYDVKGQVDCTKIEEQVRKMAGPMQKELQRLIVARAQSYNVGGFKSGRLNGPALHRLRANDDRVFKRRHIAETNKVAVSILCDNSGSMHENGRISSAMIAAWAFSEVLDRLKVPNEVLGFTSHHDLDHTDQRSLQEQAQAMASVTGLPLGAIRWYPMWVPIFKSFDERFGPEVKQRIAHRALHLDRMGHNNDAKGIEIAADRLKRRPETRKILIVFSDGMPSCHVDQSRLYASTKAAVAKCERDGIETIGVGIQTHAVKTFYPKHFVLQKVADLPKFVMGELRKLLVDGRVG